MIHRGSPRSPLYQPNLTNSERIKRWAAIPNSWTRHLTKNATLERNETRNLKPDEATPQLFHRHFVFYVQLGLGKFRRREYDSIYLVFDTASKYMWTQCEDCVNCFTQSGPLFARKSSLTYRPYPCNQCPRGKCNRDHYTSDTTFSDDTHVRGIWAKDRLTLVSPYNNEDFINDYTFVCAIDVQNFPPGREPDNIITGNLGMGNGPYSLIAQLGSRGNYQFEYCLQDPYGRAQEYYPMFLRFGDDIERLPNMATTPLFTVDGHAFYFLVLTDISVNGVNLNIPEHVFRTNFDYSGGTIIDTGSTITHLVSDAYNIVLGAVSSYINNNNPYLRKSDILFERIGTCWEPLYDSVYPDFPSLTFHLEDADLHVDPQDMYIVFPHTGIHYPGLYCLTVAETEEHIGNTIGAYHQFNYRFIYDILNSKLSFGKDDCATRG